MKFRYLMTSYHKDKGFRTHLRLIISNKWYCKLNEVKALIQLDKVVKTIKSLQIKINQIVGQSREILNLIVRPAQFKQMLIKISE